MVSESRSRGPWTARPLLGGVMSKPTAIHYQPPDYHEGHFACSVNWANGITNRWTDDPTKVKCGNCEITEVWRKSMHGTASFQEGTLKTHDPLHDSESIVLAESRPMRVHFGSN